MNKKTFTNSISLLSTNKALIGCVNEICNKKKIQLNTYSYTKELIADAKKIEPAIILISTVEKTHITQQIMSLFKNNLLFTPVIIIGKANNIADAVSSIKIGAIDYIEFPDIHPKLIEYIDTLTRPPEIHPPIKIKDN